MSVIARLAVAVDADTKGFSRGMSHVKKESAVMKKVVGSALGLIGGGTMVGAGILAFNKMSSAVSGTIAMITSMRDEIDQTAKSAAVLGMSFDELRDMQFMADLSGVSGLESSLARATRRIGRDAAGDGGPAAKALARLAVDSRKLAELNPSKQLEVLAHAFSQVDDESYRAQLAFEIFGAEGKTLLPILSGGADAVREMTAEARYLRGEFGDNAGAIEAFNDKMRRGQEVVSGLKQQMTLLAVETADMATQADNIDWVAKWTRMIPVLGAGMSYAAGTAKDLRMGMEEAKRAASLDAQIGNAMQEAAESMGDPVEELARLASGEAGGFLQKLEQRIEDLGKTADQQLLDRLFTEGADPLLLQQAEFLLKEESRITEQKEQQANAEREALALRKSQIDEMGRMKQEVAKIADLEQRGLISKAEANKAQAMAVETLNQAQTQALQSSIATMRQISQSGIGSVMAKERGSIEAFQAIDRHRQRGDTDKQLEKQTKALEAIVQSNQQIANSVRSGQVTVEMISLN